MPIRMNRSIMSLLAAGAAAAALSSCAPGSIPAARAVPASFGGGTQKVLQMSYSNSPSRDLQPSVESRRPPIVLAQAVTGATPKADADASKADATASATPVNTEVETDDPVAAECLKCHGPFAALAEKTAGYVTEWDEHANPHVHVPHESTTIVACTDCHEAHPLPIAPGTEVAKANVLYCYSCHHAETFAACSDCHKE